MDDLVYILYVALELVGDLLTEQRGRVQELIYLLAEGKVTSSHHNTLVNWISNLFCTIL